MEGGVGARARLKDALFSSTKHVNQLERQASSEVLLVVKKCFRMSLLKGMVDLILALVVCGKNILIYILTSLGFRLTLPKTVYERFYPYWSFFYASFLKPHTTVSTNGQRDALESFYSSQADAYDVTRANLLKGREDMLSLAAAQLKLREGKRDMPAHRIWIDVRAPYAIMP